MDRCEDRPAVRVGAQREALGVGLDGDGSRGIHRHEQRLTGRVAERADGLAAAVLDVPRESHLLTPMEDLTMNVTIARSRALTVVAVALAAVVVTACDDPLEVDIVGTVTDQSINSAAAANALRVGTLGSVNARTTWG